MAKKKNTPVIPLSPKAYLSTGRARKLPLLKALMPVEWEELGKFPVFVVREHVNGNVTVANLLIDILCCGVKDAHFLFNEHPDHFAELIDQYEQAAALEFESFEYNFVHNLIYESLAFAEDFGIDPHPDFALVEMILEEDTDDIPLVEVPLGREGIPFLIMTSEDSRSQYYLKQLQEHAGPGNFIVVDGDMDEDMMDDDFDEYYFEDWGESEWHGFLIDFEEEDLTPLDPIVNFIFHHCLYMPKHVAGQLSALDMEEQRFILTSEPLGADDMSATEVKVAAKIYQRLNRKNSRREIVKLMSDIKKTLIQWPENRQLYNYLSIVYDQLGEKQKRKALLTEMQQKFPDYVFGKISLGGLLLEESDFSGFLELFNHQYELKGVFPQREEFHLSEFLAFFTLMGMYFLKTGDVYMAQSYKIMIIEVLGEDMDSMNVNESFFMDLQEAILDQVKDLLSDIEDLSKREELVALLVANTH